METGFNRSVAVDVLGGPFFLIRVAAHP